MSVKIMRQGFLRDRLFSFFQRLNRHLPVVVWDGADFRRFQRYNQMADRRWVRRALTVLNLFVLAVALACWMGDVYEHHVRNLSGNLLFSRIVMFTTAVSEGFLVCMALFWANVLCRLAGMGKEDPSMLEYGIPYDKLKIEQRRPLVVRYRAELLKRCFYPDERQIAEQERAERMAFRLLRRTAILIAVVVWAVYLIAPEGAFGRLLQSAEILLHSPLIMTWMVIALLALPTLIWLWAEPGDAGEPAVVEATPKKLIGSAVEKTLRDRNP
jgi:hypothetical protein